MPRLTSADVGCWLIKSRTPAAEIGGGWAPGATKELTRCLRRSYRVELIQPGQPCVLWVSGPVAPGVQAIGAITSEASAVSAVIETAPAQVSEDRAEVQVSVLLRRLNDPVSRAAWLADHVLADAEVLRMPAGSNPSYLSPTLFAALQDYLDPAEVADVDW